MDFSRVGCNTQSRLLKGETSCIPGTGEICVRNYWWWHPKEDTCYLDLTVFACTGQGIHSIVDFQHKTMEGEDGPAITHSGDVLDPDDNKGTHTVTVNCSHIPLMVTTLVFVISAYNGAQLKDMVAASMTVEDSHNPYREMLCSYDLAAHDKQDNFPAVVMLTMQRIKSGDWMVRAIGDSHKGDATNYGPIKAAISKLL